MRVKHLFPLTWPSDQEETQQRSRRMRARRWQEAISLLYSEMTRRKIKAYYITSNLVDGKISVFKSPGVSVIYRYKGADKILACDTHYRPSDNLYAIAEFLKHQRLSRRSKVIAGEIIG